DWPAYDLQPPGIAGRDPRLWPAEDVDGARTLLAAAGFPDGKGLPRLNYAYSAIGPHTLLAEYLRQRWKQTLGVELELHDLEWKAFTQWPRTDEWATSGDIYAGGGWSTDYEDPSDWYNLLWASPADRQQFNTGWQDPAYDRLVLAAAGERDPREREALYG